MRKAMVSKVDLNPLKNAQVLKNIPKSEEPLPTIVWR